MKLKSAVKNFHLSMTIEDLKCFNNTLYFNNISYNSILYLDIIAHYDKCTVTELASMLGITKSAVTLKTNELLRKNYIEKHISVEDKRVKYLTLSKSMKKEYIEFDEHIENCLDKIKSKHSAEDISVFCSILETYSEAYRNIEKGALNE